MSAFLATVPAISQHPPRSPLSRNKVKIPLKPSGHTPRQWGKYGKTAISADQGLPHFFDVEAIYQECQLFKACSREFVRSLMQAGDSECLYGKMYDSNKVVVEYGKQAKHLHVIHRGECEVVLDGLVVTTLDAGKCFGEINLLGLSPYATATIRTKTMCHLFLVAADTFINTLKTYPRERHIFETEAMRRYRELIKLQCNSRKRELIKDTRVEGLKDRKDQDLKEVELTCSNGEKLEKKFTLRNSFTLTESSGVDRRNAVSTPPHGPSIPVCDLETCARKVAQSLTTDSKKGFKVRSGRVRRTSCEGEEEGVNIDINHLPPIQALSSAQKQGLLQELRQQVRLKVDKFQAGHGRRTSAMSRQASNLLE